MKKTILIGMLLVLCVSIAEAKTLELGIRARKGVSGLGDEMLTCGDFTCDPVEGWVDLEICETIGWCIIESADEFVSYFHDIWLNFSQVITIEEGRIYNVVFNIDDDTAIAFGTNELNFYLGGVRTNVFTDFTADGDTIFSYQITAETTDELFVEGYMSEGSLGWIYINSISVKEKLPTTVELGKKVNTNWGIRIFNFIFRL